MNIEIINAEYGSESKYIDVTDILKKENGPIVVSNAFFKKDPHFRVKKKLKIEFTINGENKVELFNEGDIFNIYDIGKVEIGIRKIYDCFTFFNELDILDIRLNEMYDIVDNFVIIEGDKTHTGIPKESYYLKNIERYAKFQDKIIHRIVELPINSQWSGEKFQRDSICDVLGEIGVDNESIVIISDADEIPCAKSILSNISYIIKKDFVSMVQTRYDYRINLLDTAHGFSASRGKIFTYGKLNKEKLFDIRFGTDGVNTIQCGWHFSWLGDETHLNEKIEAIAESKIVKRKLKTTNWDALIRDGIYFLTREKLKRVEIDETFPEYVRKNIDNLGHLISLNFFKRPILLEHVRVNEYHLGTIDGFPIGQHIDICSAIDSLYKTLLKENNLPKNIIEIGTFYGGFSILLASHKLSSDTVIHTYDIRKHGSDEIISQRDSTFQRMNISYHEIDVFNDNQLKTLINQNGLTIVFCDGGNKQKEFDVFSKYLKPGDIILAHDYVANTTVNWKWEELNPDKIKTTIVRERLYPFCADEMNNVAWACFRKPEV